MRRNNHGTNYLKKKDLFRCRSTIGLSCARSFVYLFIFVLSFYLYTNYHPEGDLYGHIQIVEQLDQGHFVAPHFLYHLTVYGISKVLSISFFSASCLTTALFVVFSMIVIENMLQSFLRDGYTDYFLLFLSLALIFVSAIYFPLINKFPYKGVWSPNPWHNPTFIAAKPFVLLIFYLYALEITKETYFEKRFSLTRISVLLVICALIKPSFILAFIPTSIVFLIFLPGRRFSMLIKTVQLLLPVLAVLVFQFLFTYYHDAAGSSSVRLCFFDIWKVHAQSVSIAVLQGTLLPLVALMVMFPHSSKDKALFLSWILFVAGFLIFGLLYETGPRKNHGNFGWTYMACLNILFIYSTIAFLQWVSEVHKKTRTFQIRIFICVSVFLLHLVSGIYYIGYLLSGHVY